MKITKVIKVLYYHDPESFGYDGKYPESITEIYNKVVKVTELDNTDTILVGEDMGEYLKGYYSTIYDAIINWYYITK